MVVGDDELRVFCKWFQEHFKTMVESKSVLLVCMCGYFHTYSKGAKELLKRCVSLQLMTVKDGVVYLK